MAETHTAPDPEPVSDHLQADLATVDAITQSLRDLVPDVEDEIFADPDGRLFDFAAFAFDPDDRWS